jgi:hypothetical protein
MSKGDRLEAIPLVQMNSSSTSGSSATARPVRESLDSETSAILSYALGKEVPGDDDVMSPRSSMGVEDMEAEAFFKDNDPMEAEYGLPQRRVLFPLLELMRNRDGFEYVYLLQ